MKYKAEINIMPLGELLDPQGKAVLGGLNNIGYTEVKNVRVGKHITLEIEAESESAAKNISAECCKRLLANPIVEAYFIEIPKMAG